MSPATCQRTRAGNVATDDPIMASVAGRYASALFDLAKEQGQLADAEKDVASVQKLLDESADLRQLVRSPVISGDDQRKALMAVLAKAGVGQLVSNFLGLVARNRRLFAAPDMIKAFRAIAARHRGEVSAEVASAQPLTEAQLTQIKDTLRVQVGKDVQLATKVDPALLGGLVVKIGSRMIDSSLRTKLNSLKTMMKEVS
jgi:F-type H+-transporting ATPase subunit delta